MPQNINKRTRISTFKTEMPDDYSRENAQRIADYTRDVPVLNAKFEFITLSMLSNGTNMIIPHSLGYKPMDYIVTYKSDNSVTFYIDIDRSTKENLSVTTSAAVNVRMLVGRYEDGSGV